MELLQVGFFVKYSNRIKFIDASELRVNVGSTFSRTRKCAASFFKSQISIIDSIPDHTVVSRGTRSHATEINSGQRPRNERGDVSHSDLVELAELQRAVAVDSRSDVLAVVAVFHRFQLTHAAHVGQARLDLCHVQHLQGHSSLLQTARL